MSTNAQLLTALLAAPAGSPIAPPIEADDDYYTSASVFSGELDNAIEEANAGYGPSFAQWLKDTIGSR